MRYLIPVVALLAVGCGKLKKDDKSESSPSPELTSICKVEYKLKDEKELFACIEIRLKSSDSRYSQASLDQGCLDAASSTAADSDEDLKRFNKTALVGACAEGGKAIDEPKTGNEDGYSFEVKGLQY
jgi:hypothetical protein